MARRKGRFVSCVKAGRYRASLEPRKVHRLVEETPAESKSPLRGVDESGEDYLYPAKLFVPDRSARQGCACLHWRGIRSQVAARSRGRGRLSNNAMRVTRGGRRRIEPWW